MKESALKYTWCGDKLINLYIYQETAACPAPTRSEEELVRIFNEHKALTEALATGNLTPTPRKGKKDE